MDCETRSSSFVTALFLSVVFVIFSSVSVMSTTVQFPETPAGERARQIVGLLNLGDKEKSKDYITNNYTPDFKDAFPMAQHIAIFTMTKSSFGQLSLKHIAESSESEIKLVLKAAAGNAWIHLQLQVEPEKPHRVSIMGIMQGDPPEGLTPDTGDSAHKVAPASSQEPANGPFANLREMDTHISGLTLENEFSGVVLVARDGIVQFHKAYGLASKNFNVPNRLDTKFNLGSLNKSFTSVAITQLIQQGELSLDDTIGKYLHDFSEEASEKVTIMHLLKMRSGWGDYWGNETFLTKRDQLRTVSDYMTFLKDLPLDFEPGTSRQHSNTSFDVLGAIVEKVTGQDYYDYVRENIYRPAGMQDTGSYHKDGPVENLATGYTNMNPYDPEGQGYEWSNVYMMPPRGTPAGGGYSTAEDMLKYDTALRTHKLLDPDHTSLLFRRFEQPKEESDGPKGRIALAGGAPGISTFLGSDFENGNTVIVLSNYDMPVAIELGETILKMVTK